MAEKLQDVFTDEENIERLLNKWLGMHVDVQAGFLHIYKALERHPKCEEMYAVHINDKSLLIFRPCNVNQIKETHSGLAVTLNVFK